MEGSLKPLPFGNWQWQEPPFGKRHGPDKQDPPAEAGFPGESAQAG